MFEAKPIPAIIFVSVAVIAAVTVRIVRHIALKKAVIDRPNNRSSHTQPIPRLGGAVFVPFVLAGAAIVAAGDGLPRWAVGAFFLGALGLFAVSLLDDLRSLSPGFRLAVQLAVAGGFVWAAFKAHPDLMFGGNIPSWVDLCLLILWIVGVVNIYNFMDGIDGIAGLQAIVAGAGWCVIANRYDANFSAALAAFTAAGALGFLTLNWSPAKIFMGDAGSTVLGYIFAAMPLLVSIESKGTADAMHLHLGAGLILWPFLADAGFTILRRLRRRENILQAHRSHVYQRLVIAGVSPSVIAGIYGGLAVIGTALAWLVLTKEAEAVAVAVVVPLVCSMIVWRWTVLCERAK